MWGEDTLWLDIYDKEASCIIRQTPRLRTLVHSLRAPYTQTPTLVLFFESPERRYFPLQEESGVHLRLDSETSNGQCPLLVASTQSLFSHWPSRSLITEESCASSIVQELSFPRHESVAVLPRLLLPFTDIICFKCTNQSDVRIIEAQISQWSFVWREAGTGTPMPGVVVLLADDDNLQPVSLQNQLFRKFPSAKISVVRMDHSTWAVNGLWPIRKRLGQAASRSRRWKASHKVLFSAFHVLGLFEESFGAVTLQRPFHYIQASRSPHPVASDLVQHLNNYAQVLPACYDEDSAAESIASSFLLDHFTPRMHG